MARPLTYLTLLAACPSPVPAQVAPPADQPRNDTGRVVTRTMRVQQRIIIRVPRAPVTPAAMAGSTALPPMNWVEQRSAKCVPLARLAAATISQSGSIDLLLTGGSRLRARLESECPALDFYSGVYLKGTSDGQICAQRDTIRSRSGGQCRITALRALVPGR